MEYDEEMPKCGPQTNPWHREEAIEYRRPQSSKKTIKVKLPELSLSLSLSLNKMKYIKITPKNIDIIKKATFSGVN